MMLLMKLLGGSSRTSVKEVSTVNEAPTVTATNQNIQQEIDRVKADADTTIKGLKFSAAELKAMQGKNKDDQYAETVSKALGLNWNRGAATFTSGAFAGTKNNSVTTQGLVDKNVMSKDWNWNLSDLESSLGTNGMKDGTKAVLKDLNSALAANSAFHSSPFHLGQAQKLLDKSREIDDFISKNSVSDSDLASKAKELKDLAKLHFSIAGSTESPIIFDTDGSGKIELTSVKDGVQFDIDGDGKKD